MLARLQELAAFVLDLLEQPHVLDRDHRLVSKSPEQLDLFLGKRPHRGARKYDRSDWAAFSNQWNTEHRAKACLLLHFEVCVFRIRQNVRYLNGLAFQQ